jgi:alcohol dehydrogenase
MLQTVEPFTLPRWIEAKPGCLDNVGAWSAKFGKKALIGCGKSMARRSGALGRVEESLKRAGLAYEIFEGVPPEPAIPDVEAAAALARKAGCDVFIALGGGSVLDTVKLAAIMSVHEGPLADYQLQKLQFKPHCPAVIAIPTTAGTGSEATKVSVITNPALGVKKGVYSWDMLPTVVLLDAALCLDLPPDITRDTGLDALGQAIEGYLSTANNALIQAHAARAVQLIRVNLPRAVRDGHDLEARHNMLLAAYCGGVSIGTGVGLGHEMAMAVGSLRHLPHGKLVGILTPYCLKVNLGWADERIAELAWYFGCRSQDSARASGEDLVRALAGFNSSLGLERSLGELGVTVADIGRILELTPVSTTIRTNPRPQDDSLRRQVLEEAIAGAEL